jgi:hypothetical protein
MTAGNRPPLGFEPILLVHASVLLAALFLENLRERSPGLFAAALAAGLLGAGAAGVRWRGFLWDLFGSLRSAVVLLALLFLACAAGGFLVQERELRREGLSPGPEDERGPGGGAPRFRERAFSGRFAIEQARRLLALLPSASPTLDALEERRRALLAEEVGPEAAETYRESLLAERRRDRERTAAIEHARRHFARFYFPLLEWAKRLRLLDLFGSWWFAALLGLLAVNVAAGMLARAPWSLRESGIALLHAGVLVLLAGALLDRLAAREGVLHFDETPGGVADAMEEHARGATTPLPFRVRLERARTERAHELLVRCAGGGPEPVEAEARLPLREGEIHRLAGGAVEVEVAGHEPRVRVQTAVRERPGGPLAPALRVGLYRAPEEGRELFAAEGREPWLFASDPDRAALDLGSIRVEYLFAPDAETYRRLLATAPTPDNGGLLLRGERAAEVLVPVVLRTSRRVTVGTRTVRIAPLAIEPFLGRPRLLLGVDGAPAIELEPGEERPIDGLSVRFRWDAPRVPAIARLFRVVEGAGLPRTLVCLDAAGEPKAIPLALGARVALEGTGGLYLAAEDAARSAEERRETEPLSDADFVETGAEDLVAAQVKLRIRGPHGEVEAALTPFDAALAYGPRLQFRVVPSAGSRGGFSTLALLRDGALLSLTARPGRPARHGDFAFLHGAKIAVSYRPGADLLRAGSALLGFGLLWILLVAPALPRRAAPAPLSRVDPLRGAGTTNAP